MYISEKEFEAYSNENEVLSDMDYGFNKDSDVYNVPSIEWDGPYGKHWSRYVSEEARTNTLDEYDKDLNNWVRAFRIKEAKRISEKKMELKRVANLSTLGGQFPDLFELINAL